VFHSFLSQNKATFCRLAPQKAIHAHWIMKEGIACWDLNSLDRAKVPDKLKNVKWKELSCGGGHTCAIDVNGWPACWGFGKHGQVNSKQLQKHF
jgi:alpha-tubulin suppressor-like RCC1 family protein